MINLVVTNRKTNDIKRYKLNQNTIVFGRAANCDVVLDSETVSRRHVRLIINRNLVEVEDLGSGNGTILNQAKIASKERVPLKSGDQIRIEEFTIDVEADEISELKLPPEGATPNFEITDPDILEIKMIKKILGAFDHDKRPGFIVVTTPFQHLRAFFEDGEEFYVGRDPKCPLYIDSQTVSRKHAKIEKKWGGFEITDLESKNGTYVNGEKITQKSLADGDEVVFGTIKAIFKNPEEFNIETISRTMVQEQQARDKIQEAAEMTSAELKQHPQTKAEPAKNADPIIHPPAKPAEPEVKKSDKTQEKQDAKPVNSKDDEKQKMAKSKSPDDDLAAIDALNAEQGQKTKTAPQKAKPIKPVKAGWSFGEVLLLLFGIMLLFVIGVGLFWVLR